MVLKVFTKILFLFFNLLDILYNSKHLENDTASGFSIKILLILDFIKKSLIIFSLDFVFEEIHTISASKFN